MEHPGSRPMGAGSQPPGPDPATSALPIEGLPPEQPERSLFADVEPEPTSPDVAGDLPAYRAWQRQRQEARLAADPGPATRGPAVAVLIVVDGLAAPWLHPCLQAIVSQTYTDWELVVATTGSDLSGTTQVLADVVPSDRRARVVGPRPAGNDPGNGDSGDAETALDALRQAIPACNAPFLVILGQQDVLAPDALALLVEAALGRDRSDGDAAPQRGSAGHDGGSGGSDQAGQLSLAYADEDQVDAAGQLACPALKPGWSPDLLLSTPYFGHPVLVTRQLWTAAGGIRILPGADWEHDLMLRLSEQALRIAHVPEVLCHRQGPRSDPTAIPLPPGLGVAPAAPGPGAVVAALERRGEQGTVEAGTWPHSWHVRRLRPGRPTVSAIVPFRDGAPYLRMCVDSVTTTAGNVDLQLVLVDNGSVEPETASLVERLAERPGVTVVRDPRPFNWAALNNAATAATAGEVLLFLNNDIRALAPGWMAVLAAHALRPDVGVAGARLLYPDGRLQHAGMVIGIGAVAGHVLARLPGDDPGYLGQAVLTRECSAVTGACMAVRASVFAELDGFDDQLAIDLNDVDFCLRARQHGYRVVYEPLAELVHYESPSRGRAGSVPDIRRFVDRWEDVIVAGDPYLSPHLTRVDGSCALRRPDEEEQQRQWRSTLHSS